MNLETRDKAVMYLLLRRPMNLEHLIMTMYIIDRELYHRHGYTLFRWKASLPGPWSNDLYKTVKHLEKHHIIHKTQDDTLNLYTDKTEPDLNPQITEVIEEVLKTLKPNQLEDYIYTLPEIKNTPIETPLLKQ